MSRVEGADELLRDLRKLGAEMPQVERQMLKAGGEEMAAAWRDEIDRRGFISEGEKETEHMRDHITYKLISRKGKLRAEITATGEVKRKNRIVRHAEKAFYLHYGTSKIPASHWIDSAEAQGMPPTSAAMAAVLDEKLKSTIGANR